MKHLNSMEVARFYDVATTLEDVKPNSTSYIVMVTHLSPGMFTTKLFKIEFRSNPTKYARSVWALADILSANGELLSKDTNCSMTDKGIMRNYDNDNLTFQKLTDALDYITYVMSQRPTTIKK